MYDPDLHRTHHDHELLYPLQCCGDTPLHLAAEEGHTTCVEYLLSTPGIDVNIKDEVSWQSQCQQVVFQLVGHKATAAWPVGKVLESV